MIRFNLLFEKGGVYADPDSVSLKLLKPDNTLFTPSPVPVRVSAGVWQFDFDTADVPPGTWTYRAEGDGHLDAATEGTFVVTPSAFAAL